MKNFYSIFLTILFASIFLATPVVTKAQEAEEAEQEEVKPENKAVFAPYWYLRGTVGGSFWHGDLGKSKFVPNLENAQFGGEFGAGRQFLPWFGLNLMGYTAAAKGENEGKMQWYKGNVLDGSLNATLNFSNLIGGYKDRTVSIGGFLGVGYGTFFGSRVYLYDTKTLIREVDNGSYLVVPAGFNVDFRVNEKWDVNLKYTFKMTDTDSIDGYQGGAMALKNDMYGFLGAGLTYKFGYGGNINTMAKNFDAGVSMKADPDVLEEHGETVKVNVTGKVEEKYMAKNAAVYLQPVLKYEGGEYALKPITLKGEDVPGEGTLIARTGGSFSYTDEIPYDPAMENSELVVEPVIYIPKAELYDNKDDIMANTKYVTVPERKLADGVITTSQGMAGDESFAWSGHMYEKETIITEGAGIYFPKNMYNLNWYLELNKKQESKDYLMGMFDHVKKGWDIKSIDIHGWASPEGEETFNDGLSANRAAAAEKFLKRKLNKIAKSKDVYVPFENADDIEFNITAHGPDWQGFMKNVQASDFKDKNVVLNVINSSASNLQKEEEIRNMILIYPELEEYMLPPLRRAVIKVNSYEPKRADEQIFEYATTYPDSLNIKELLYAADNAKCDAKLGIYEYIMDKYPKCWRSKNNAGVLHMKHEKYDKAKALFEEADALKADNAEVINNMGILAFRTGDYAAAEKYFMQAQSLGQDENYNLALIAIHKGDYSKAIQLFGSTKCDYNVALAYVMLENYEKAESHLKCYEGCTGKANYLMAIIGSRTDNTAKMYEHLTKVVKEYPEAKAKIAKDREFIKFYDEPDFKAIVE